MKVYTFLVNAAKMRARLSYRDNNIPLLKKKNFIFPTRYITYKIKHTEISTSRIIKRERERRDKMEEIKIYMFHFAITYIVAHLGVVHETGVQHEVGLVEARWWQQGVGTSNRPVIDAPSAAASTASAATTASTATTTSASAIPAAVVRKRRVHVCLEQKLEKKGC